ncbi:indolepyruvate oxidoreductase subunit beta [Maledivibacter halophilus]|uniref:Indolepyruvate ferredoxin oxidoreductase beta subunit n=1 Tax=Maledivibacter halophilus TaxID=36842 RepID=A0A1T5LKE1_9FIRM|nr:indolepyruvate oxidoreductase subunit beta [Maledivibacter halophilus]SKC76461.1 indolepyruvate ferredoxin oxidoreductase beta subunit [Maledivibacter halophilus]
MTEISNFIICGVGGQGIVLTSDIISNTFLESGWDVKATDIIGLGQRGGSVVTHVRVGNDIISPLIKKGKADIILAFEKYESLRWCNYLKEDGELIINNKSIIPTSVTEKIEKDIDLNVLLDKLNYKNSLVDISIKLENNGINAKCTNLFMVGILSRKTNIKYKLWEEIIKRNVKKEFREDNIRAFKMGRNLFIS